DIVGADRLHWQPADRRKGEGGQRGDPLLGIFVALPACLMRCDELFGAPPEGDRRDLCCFRLAPFLANVDAVEACLPQRERLIAGVLQRDGWVGPKTELGAPPAIAILEEPALAAGLPDLQKKPAAIPIPTRLRNRLHKDGAQALTQPRHFQPLRQPLHLAATEAENNRKGAKGCALN